MSSLTTAAPTAGSARGVARLPWLAVAGAAVVVGVAAVAGGPTPWWVLLAFGLAPDLSFLAAVGAGPVAKGQLPPRAVPVYNLVHRPVWPLSLMAVAAIGAPSWVLVAGAGWLAHIAVDRSVGYGPRTADGWQRG